MAEPATTTARKEDERNYLRKEVRRLIGEGKTDEEIKLELALSDQAWSRYQTVVLEQERARAKRPSIEIFVEYQLRQLAYIDQLEAARKNATKASDEIAAIKAKAELLDKIIARGQELGVIHKEGQKVTFKGALGLVHMTPTELAEQLDYGMTKLQALATDLGHPLEVGNLTEAARGRPPLRLVEPAIAEATSDPALEVEPYKEADPFEETDPGPLGPPPEVAPDPDSAVPEPITGPEVTVPERRTTRRSRGTTGLKRGVGDPGPSASKAERLYEAAMHPRSDARTAKKGEIVGDPAGLRGRVHIQCPRCSKRIQGIPGLARHLGFLHQLANDEALKMAQEAAEHERMAVARAYVDRTGGPEDDPEGAV